MRVFNRQIDDFVQSRRDFLVRYEERLKTEEPGSDEAQRARDIIYGLKSIIRDFENNVYISTPPNLTFNQGLNLDLGDLTLKLVYFGEGRHTGDDILIHCPEEKLVFAGDLFYHGSMQLSWNPVFDGEQWIKALEEVLKDEDEVELVFDAHNGRMTGDFLALWRDYLVDMWRGLSDASRKGLDFEQVQDLFSYDKKFTYLEKSGLDPAHLRKEHLESLRHTWNSIKSITSSGPVKHAT
jgi:glyoxylase-like metal-dependent hydrolase (beta-lactamase superfamily II)